MLNLYSGNLDKAAAAHIGLQGIKGREVLQEIANASRTCTTTIDYYDDKTPIPWSVLEAVMETQRAIARTVDATILMMTLGLDLGN